MAKVIPIVRIVDDDETFCMSQKMFLQAMGWFVLIYNSAKTFLEDDDPSQPGCLILDMRMPEMTGLELQTALVARGAPLPIIFLTGHGDVNMAVHALQHGAFDFLQKPVDPEKLNEGSSSKPPSLNDGGADLFKRVTFDQVLKSVESSRER